MKNKISLWQERIANTSVGASTVRGNEKGTAKAIRQYFKNLDLNDYSNAKKYYQKVRQYYPEDPNIQDYTRQQLE
jgi:hypothetical protein